MARPKQPGLTENELAVMTELWTEAPLTVTDLLARLKRRPKPAYTSLLTLVQAMEKKGYIAHEKLGKAFSYYPKLEQQKFVSGEVVRISSRLFGGNPLSLVMNLIRSEHLSREDLRQLKKILEDQ